MKQLLIFVLCLKAFAALPSTTTWEIRPTAGSDSNGGAFVTGASGTDFSQQNSAQYTFSDLASTSGTTNPCIVTSASHNFVAADVGNIIQINSGTNWTAGFYEIVSAATNAATLDRACASSASVTSGTFHVGGALSTIGQMHTILTTSNENATGQTVWVKASGTISIASGITFSPSGGYASNKFTTMSGYTSSRGDNGQVTIQASAGSFIMLTMQPSLALIVRNFLINCNSQTSSTGGSWLGSNFLVDNVLVEGCTNDGIRLNNQNNILHNVRVTTSAGTAFTMDQGNGPNYCIDCVAYSNTGVGFKGAYYVCIRCVAGNNSGASSDGFQVTSNSGSLLLDHVISYTNGRDGIRFTAWENPAVIQNSIFYGNAGTDVNNVTGSVPAGSLVWNYNAYVSGHLTNMPAGGNDVNITVDPFVSGVANNYALNSTAGGGTALKQAAFPGTLGGAGTGYADIGTLQSQGSTGGGQKGFPIVQ